MSTKQSRSGKRSRKVGGATRRKKPHAASFGSGLARITGRIGRKAFAAINQALEFVVEDVANEAHHLMTRTNGRKDKRLSADDVHAACHILFPHIKVALVQHTGPANLKKMTGLNPQPVNRIFKPQFEQVSNSAKIQMLKFLHALASVIAREARHVANKFGHKRILGKHIQYLVKSLQQDHKHELHRVFHRPGQLVVIAGGRGGGYVSVAGPKKRSKHGSQKKRSKKHSRKHSKKHSKKRSKKHSSKKGSRK